MAKCEYQMRHHFMVCVLRLDGIVCTRVVRVPAITLENYDFCQMQAKRNQTDTIMTVYSFIEIIFQRCPLLRAAPVQLFLRYGTTASMAFVARIDAHQITHNNEIIPIPSILTTCHLD